MIGISSTKSHSRKIKFEKPGALWFRTVKVITMTDEHKIILNAIETALNKDPELRFGQVLFNLGINEFANSKNPQEANYRLRDIHGDKDSAIIKRIKKRLKC